MYIIFDSINFKKFKCSPSRKPPRLCVSTATIPAVRPDGEHLIFLKFETNNGLNCTKVVKKLQKTCKQIVKTKIGKYIS